MEYDIKIDGLEELDKRLGALGADVGSKSLKTALMAAAKPMLDDMKENVPVDRGLLQKSIARRSKIRKTGNTTSIAVVRVGAVSRKAGWRAHLVEFGTSKTEPKPFIMPASDKFHESVAVFKKRLIKILDKAEKKKIEK